MADDPPHIRLNIQLTFQSDGHPHTNLVWGQSDISIKYLSTSSFYKVFHNDKNAQCGMNHMCTVASQNYTIYQL